MEWKNNLRRTQSLKTITSSWDKPARTDAGQWDKKVSVSQLVSRYQTTMEVNASVQAAKPNNDEVKPKQVQREITPSPLESKEIHLDSKTRRNDEREQSQANPSLMRTKSMGSLQNSPGSIKDLKAWFESKSVTKSTVADFMSPADVMPVMNGQVEKGKRSGQEQKTHVPPDVPVKNAKTDAKEDPMTQTTVKKPRIERRKTIGGIDFKEIAASQVDDKRRSVADFRESSFVQNNEKLSVSVKELSALYLSKVAPQELTQSPLKLAYQSPESGKRVKIFKFQPTCQEMCYACLKPVYPMEKITADKYSFHKTCFVCKQCKKKLSMHNYTPLHGEFYCIFHYRQLFRKKGNYDEGFGFAQHKNQWLVRKTANVGYGELEA